MDVYGSDGEEAACSEDDEKELSIGNRVDFEQELEQHPDWRKCVVFDSRCEVIAPLRRENRNHWLIVCLC